MSQNIPFIFASGGQPPPASQAQQQQHYSTLSPQQQSQFASAQQAAFHQNAQLPIMDMSALAGISPEQLAAIGRLFQTGALTLPPQSQGASAQNPVTVPAATQAAPSAPHLPQIANATPAQEQDVDMDKEEGELEEGEVGDMPEERGFLRPPPTGPRNRSASPRGPPPKQRKQSPRPPNRKQPVNKSKQAQPQQTQGIQLNGRTNGHVQAGNEEAAKRFVLEMVKSGYSYEDLVKETKNPKPLIRLFKQLHLPIPSNDFPKKPPQNNDTAAVQAQPLSPGLKSPLNEEIRKTSVTKRPPPAKPVDRSEYLARLAAAKNKKADTVTVQETPAKPVEKPPAPPETTQQVQASETVATISANAKPSAVGKADKTELARRRLEALKAQQAAKQNGALQPNGGVSMSSPIAKPIAPTTDSRMVISSPTQSGLGSGLADIPAKASHLALTQQHSTQPTPLPPAPRQVVSPTPPTPSRSFSGLPGLFMVGTPTRVAPATPVVQPVVPSQPNQLAMAPSVPEEQAQVSIIPVTSNTLAATPTASPAPLAVPRKRPVAADFDDVSAKPSFTKRPFGQSRGNSEDESLIIELSEDEDDDEDDMEVDDPAAPSMIHPQTKSFRDVGPLRDFPPRPNFSTQVSGASTPGTPGGVTYEQRLKEIEEMKRKIAEAEKRKNASGKIVGGKINEPAVTNGTSAAPTPAVEGSSITTNFPLASGISPIDGLMGTTPQTTATTHAHSVSSDRPTSAATLARQQEKERLRQRLLELERDESKDVAEAVEAAVAEPEPVLSGTPVGTIAPVNSETAQMLEAIDGQKTSVEAANNSVSEEGEMSDDSMSNIYDLPNAQDTRADQSAPVIDDRKVGSQTTTASATSGLEQVQNESETAMVNGSQLPDSIAHNTDIGEKTIAQAEITTPVETQLPDSPAQDSVMPDVMQEPVALSESMNEDEEEDDEDYSDGDEEDDENHDDLDQQLSSRQTDHISAQHDNTLRNGREEGEIDDDDSSSASATDIEDYEPEPVEESAMKENQVGKDAAMTAVSDVSATEAVDEGKKTEVDLAPELQLADEQQMELSDKEPAKSARNYTPYESGLKMFKAYRWHPNFLNDVQGGFKSMTYSHNIDPNKPLCPFEAAGGKCNDRTCQNQHFRDMVQSDNDLLRDLGTTNLPTHTPEETRKWNEGLGVVIRQLRTTNQGRDANAIAAKISEFRREFIGDPTKVLNLG